MSYRATLLLLLSVLAGLLMAVAFPLGPPVAPRWDGFWQAGWLCLAPLMVAAARAGSPQAGAACGLASGAVAFGLVLSWMHPFLVRWGQLSGIEAAAVTGLLVLYVALHFAAFGALVALWAGRWGHPTALLLAPAAWTGLEVARDRLLAGFPWCLLGYSQQPVLAAIQVAELAGVYGVSFVLASFSAAVACGVQNLFSIRRAGQTAATALLLAIAAAGLLWGRWRLDGLAFPGDGSKVALVQANVDQADKWDPAESDRIEEDHFRMTREAALRGSSLAIWSESSVPRSITDDPQYAGRLAALARETGARLLVGSVAYDRVGAVRVPYNSAFLVSPSGDPAARYDKQKLVPFGEYVPIQRLLFFLEPLVQEAGDFHSGRSAGVLRDGELAIGPLICYEAIFTELARASVRAGAEALVNMTNDAWYGDTAMPRQHLAQSIFRAVETRRYLLRCASTGISAVVEPSGRIAARLPLGEQAILETVLPAMRQTTLYVATGDLFGIACGILSALALSGAARSSRGAAPSGGPNARRQRHTGR